MIVTILILLYLGWQTYKGFQIGFTCKIVNLILSVVFFSLAIILQNPSGNFLYNQYSGQNTAVTSNQMELMAARFIIFLIIFYVSKHIKKMFSKWLSTKKSGKSFSSLLDGTLGALISLIVTYSLVYVIPSMRNALQNQWFIQQTVDSPFLHFIVYQTPNLSSGVFSSLFSTGKAAG